MHTDESGIRLSDSHEQELLKQIQLGEMDAFGDLYELYRARLYGYCSRLLRNRNDVEDVLHETFLKAFNVLETLKDASRFRAWLFRIARNEVYTLLRKRESRREEFVDEICSSETPLDELVSLERKEIVQRILSSLKVEYQEVIILREFELLSYAEIAQIMGDTESSVKSRLFKARKTLIRKLQPFFEEE